LFKVQSFGKLYWIFIELVCYAAIFLSFSVSLIHQHFTSFLAFLVFCSWCKLKNFNLTKCLNIFVRPTEIFARLLFHFSVLRLCFHFHHIPVVLKLVFSVWSLRASSILIMIMLFLFSNFPVLWKMSLSGGKGIALLNIQCVMLFHLSDIRACSDMRSPGTHMLCCECFSFFILKVEKLTVFLYFFFDRTIFSLIIFW